MSPTVDDNFKVVSTPVSNQVPPVVEYDCECVSMLLVASCETWRTSQGMWQMCDRWPSVFCYFGIRSGSWHV